VLGGLSSDGRTASAELYDPGAGTWTPSPPMLTGRALHTATLLPSSAVLVAGGFGEPTPAVPNPVLTEAEISDPAPGPWRRTGSPVVPHSGHTATQLPSGRVLVVDGIVSDPGPSISNTELFDPESETWSDAGCMLEARVSHTATLLSSGAVLVAGGTASGAAPTANATSSAELYGIVVSPAQMSLAPGVSQRLTASGGSGLGYVWSFMQNNSNGTLTPSGDYQAGPVGGVTDVVQVADSLANSVTVTVNVIRQPSVVSATSPHASSTGCRTTDGTALPSLAGAVLVLLGWRVWRPRRSPGTRTS
jgi:galactose oxidase-like protein